MNDIYIFHKVWRQRFNHVTIRIIMITILLHMIVISPTRASVRNYTVVGDVNLGGLFPLHNFNETTESCEPIRSIDSLKKLEAMVYAIKQVNEHPTLLSNITLGFEIYDTCYYDSRTLRECLNLIPSSTSENIYSLPGNCAGNQPDKLPIVGVVGAQRSSSSLQAALLLGQYHIPQISYLSTSDELSNNVRYPYFLRTVGPDRFQVAAMIDILLYYNWSYVSFVYTDDSYGIYAEQMFRSNAPAEGICIGLTRRVSRSDTDEDYDRVVSNLMDKQRGTNATVVILFLHAESARNMFSAATRLNAQRRFIWIGSDGWGNYGEQATRGNEESALGSFTVVPASEILPDFNDYFRSLTPTDSNNPWLPEFLTQICHDEAIPLGSNCNYTGLIESVDSDLSSHETLVMDAVFAFAHALDSIYRKCPDTESGVLCPEMLHIEGDLLLRELLETSFTSPANGNVRFRSRGEVSGRYSIRHMRQLDDGSYKFVSVGEWEENLDKKRIIQQKVPWYLPRDPYTGVPQSVCSAPCGKGEKKNVNLNNLCCWTCIPCRSNEIVVNNNTECLSCVDRGRMIFAWPDSDFTDCVPIVPDRNSWTIGVTVTSGLGILVTIATIVLYSYNYTHALIKASSRELSYIILIGILLAYISSILWVNSLTTSACVFLRLLSTIAKSLIYVALAVKTVRLFRIFRASVKSAKRPKFISPKSQIAVTLAITLIPLFWTVIWMSVDPPQIITEMPYTDLPEVQVHCSSRTRSLAPAIGVIVWDIGVVIVCLILGFLTRRLPENYNESRFIAICAFCSLLVFVAFSFTSVDVNIVPEVHHRAGFSAVELIVNATATLCCLFIVKLYAVYYVKLEKWNVILRKSSTLKRFSSYQPTSKSTEDVDPPDNQETTKPGIENAGFSPEEPPDERELGLEKEVFSCTSPLSHDGQGNDVVSEGTGGAKPSVELSPDGKDILRYHSDVNCNSVSEEIHL